MSQNPRINDPAGRVPNTRYTCYYRTKKGSLGETPKLEASRQKTQEEASSKVTDTPTGTVTFLFTDIEGSTALHESYPEQMWAALMRHDVILRTNVEAHGGYVFSTGGDAFCTAFDTARQALEAALAVQRALFAERWPENVEVRVRMGLHTGAAKESEGNYFGPPVNRVARLLSAGHGGQILLSSVTYGLVRDHLDHLEPGAELRDLGEHRLKDLRHTEHIHQLVVPDLPEEFPPLKTHGLVAELINLDRRYERARWIGGGGFGDVYLTRHATLDRDMALKVLGRQYANDKQFVERFKREAKSAASLSHPNIVAVHDAGEGIFEGRKASYIAMEYVSGGTLKERMEEGPLPPHTAVELALQVARALQVAHRRGIVHRDIKPQNILLTQSGEAKVADFGIATAAASSTALTSKGVMLGTLHYISPEQAHGETASPRSDLYSLGVVLYEMLTGKLPYDADTPAGIMMKHIAGQLRAPKEINPDVSEGINAACVRLLAKDPNERYPDAAALIEDLERVKNDPGTVVDETGATTPDLQRTRDDPGAIEEDALPTTTRVPDLAGQKLARARSTLAGANLSLGSRNEATSETVPEGGIVEQEPAAGTEAEQDSSVDVTISTGPSTVEVPYLAGQNLARARSKLAAAGLKLGGKDEAPSNTVTKGGIIEQEPAARTKVEEGSPVSVTVSTGLSIVEVPDLRSQNVSRASGTLNDNGLKLGAQKKVPSDTVPEGEIIGQSPKAGTEVASDGFVSVTVSSGPVKATTVPGLSDRSTEEAERASSNTRPVPAGSRTEENRRVGPEDSSRQTAQGATVRSGRRAKLWIGVGLLCAVVGVGLIAALAYSLTGEETADFTLTSTLSGHSNPVISVAFSPDGNLLASSSTDKTVKLWDPQSGEEFQTLGGSNPVFSVAFSPDGSLLASGSVGGPNVKDTVKLWDPQTGEELRTLSGHSNAFSVAFSPDGNLLASGSSDKTVKLWDPQSEEEIRTLSGHSGPVTEVAFSPDGSLLASGSGLTGPEEGDKTVKLWDPQSGEELRTLSGHSGGVDSVAFSPDGSLLASGSQDDTVKLWDPQSGKEIQTFSSPSGPFASVAFSPDGHLLASGSGDGIKLWNPQSGEEIQTLSGPGPVVSVAFSPDGSLLASGGGGPGSGTVTLWERAEDEQ